MITSFYFSKGTFKDVLQLWKEQAVNLILIQDGEYAVNLTSNQVKTVFHTLADGYKISHDFTSDDVNKVVVQIKSSELVTLLGESDKPTSLVDHLAGQRYRVSDDTCLLFDSNGQPCFTLERIMPGTPHQEYTPLYTKGKLRFGYNHPNKSWIIEVINPEVFVPYYEKYPIGGYNQAVERFDELVKLNDPKEERLTTWNVSVDGVTLNSKFNSADLLEHFIKYEQSGGNLTDLWYDINRLEQQCRTDIINEYEEQGWKYLPKKSLFLRKSYIEDELNISLEDHPIIWENLALILKEQHPPSADEFFFAPWDSVNAC